MTATVKDGLGGCRFVEWVETIGSSIANAETKSIDLLSVSADRVEVGWDAPVLGARRFWSLVGV